MTKIDKFYKHSQVFPLDHIPGTANQIPFFQLNEMFKRIALDNGTEI